MAVLDLIKPSVKAVRLIASAQADLKAALKLPAHINSLGLLTADSDDVAYIAADEATKQAQVEVVFGRSLYAGAAHSSSPTAGEVLIILGGGSPAEVRAGLDSMMATIADGPAFRWANETEDCAFLAHVVSRSAPIVRANRRAAGRAAGLSDRAAAGSHLRHRRRAQGRRRAIGQLCAAAVGNQLLRRLPHRRQAACSAACQAFTQAVLDVGRQPITLM